MATELRKSGIDLVGDIPWGTHFCHFYETQEDLFDILIPYFNMGLQSNELCVWVVFPPQSADETVGALRRAIPGVDQRIAAGDLEILPHAQWYLKGGSFDQQWLIARFQEKLTRALAAGYAGIRANGNEAWLKKEHWKDFSEYEEKLNEVIADQRVIVLCTYLLSLLQASDVFDVTRTHQFAVAKRRGEWEVVESPKLKEAKAELKRLNEELRSALSDLGVEVADRRLAEEALRRSEGRLRDLSSRLLAAQEEEQRRVARELHDNIGSYLTGIKIGLESAVRVAERGEAQPGELQGLVEMVRHVMRESRRIMTDLRPAVLDNHGIALSLRWLCERFGELYPSVRIVVDVEEIDCSKEMRVVIFRVLQEALSNAGKHSRSPVVRVSLKRREEGVELRVEDEGVGFRVEEALGRGLGLTSMRERVELAQGTFSIDSAPGRRTTILAFWSAQTDSQH